MRQTVLGSAVACLLQAFIAGPADAQSMPAIQAAPPEFGTVDQAASTANAPDSPLPEGLSFQSLRELMKEMAAPDGSALRGAREVAIFRQAAPAVVLIKTDAAYGSGVILPNGWILTNRHVVQGVGAVQVFLKPNDLADGKQAAEMRVGKVQYVDPKRDLAIVVPTALPSGQRKLNLAARDDLEVGADVWAIGHPLGYIWTFTQGIVSAVRTFGEGKGVTVIQTQTPINSGNSGGPLLNANVEVVGINTLVHDISDVEEKQVAGEKVALARPAQGLNFAVSARDVRQFLGDIEQGRITNLALQMPSTPGCAGKLLATGRTKANDGGLQAFSLRCDDKADAWLVTPDNKAEAKQFLLDPDRSGRASVIVFADVTTGAWVRSYWDFFRDETYAVLGIHENGSIKPSRFEFKRS